ncbi:DNA-binding HxlR family transcriptional regulator [Clostridiales Family XIII bacterium PM5-7]
MTDAIQGTNPYLFALSCISGKWKTSILHHIHHYGFIRFSKTKKTFPISEKVLSQQLKELVADGLIERIQYNEIPLRVEYHLTPVGQKIIPALDLIYVWSIDRMRELDIEIDPDAFIVHPEEKYEKAIQEFLKHYEDDVL